MQDDNKAAGGVSKWHCTFQPPCHHGDLEEVKLYMVDKISKNVSVATTIIYIMITMIVITL